MRNFEEEYKNYINEEVPDLWSRIEPQLQDKIADNNKTDAPIADCQKKIINEVTNQQKGTKKNQIYIFAKRALPAVAAILVLAIGVGVLQTSRYAKNESDSLL